MCCGRKPVKRRSNMKMRKIGGGKKLTIQSVPLKTLMMCRPDFFAVTSVINPWMNISVMPNKSLAIEQWDDLKDRIREYSGETLFIPSKPDLTQMSFTADAGLIFKDQNIVVLSNFRSDERKNEEQYFLEWFLERGYVVQTVNAYFESGDAFFFNGSLVGGYGPNTDLIAYDEIRPIAQMPIITVELIDPRFFHLDMCFCPLSGTDYLIYPNAFNDNGLATIRSLGGSEIVVPTSEANRFVCNSICIGRTVLMPMGCPETKAVLEQKSYKVVEIDMSEFIKAGGTCKALTLSL